MALDGFVKARIGLELGPVNVERHAQNEMAKIFNFCTLTVLKLVAGIIEKVADVWDLESHSIEKEASSRSL